MRLIKKFSIHSKDLLKNKIKFSLVALAIIITISLTTFVFYSWGHVGERVDVPSSTLFFTDWDGDNDQDILTSNGKVFENKDGSFKEKFSFGFDIFFGSKLFYDLDQDNLLDYIIWKDDHNVSIFMNKGNFEFDRMNYEVPYYNNIEILDWNNDGYPDLSVSNETHTSLYHNDVSGGFYFFETFNLSHPICNTNMISNGVNEVIISNRTHVSLISYIDDTYKQETFSWEFYSLWKAPNTHYEFDIIDTDGDGDKDLVGYSFRSFMWAQSQNRYADFILENNYPSGLRKIDLKSEYDADNNTISHSNEKRFLFDMDGDDDLDMVAFVPWSEVTDEEMNIFVRMNDGNNLFKDEKIYRTLPMSTVYVMDLNDDSYPEIVSGSSNTEKISILKNSGDGSFSRKDIEINGIRIIREEDPSELHFKDIDSDGDFDIVASCYNGGSVVIFINGGGFDFSEQVLYPVSLFGLVPSTYVTDIDHDGDLDIVSTDRTGGYADYEYEIIVLYNNGNGNYRTFGYYTFVINKFILTVCPIIFLVLYILNIIQDLRKRRRS